MNNETKFWFLRDHKFFNVLSNTELQEICLVSNFKTAKKNERIDFNWDDTPRVYFLKKGTIKIIEIDENGNEILKDVLQKGDIFGENGLVDGLASNEYAVAISESISCCSFTKENFEKLITQNPRMGLTYTKWIGLRFKKLQNKYSNLMFKDVRTRLIHFINDWAATESQDTQQNTITLKNYLTHQDIASLVCSTRQTVTQILNDFKTQNLIDYTRTEMIILDKKALVGQLTDK